MGAGVWAAGSGVLGAVGAGVSVVVPVVVVVGIDSVLLVVSVVVPAPTLVAGEVVASVPVVLWPASGWVIVGGGAVSGFVVDSLLVVGPGVAALVGGGPAVCVAVVVEVGSGSVVVGGVAAGVSLVVVGAVPVLASLGASAFAPVGGVVAVAGGAEVVSPQ